MPQSAENSSSPADQPPPLARRADPAARDRPPENDTVRLAEDIEVDRKVLERLRADYELHAGRVAELETQIEALKLQGNQLVKRLQTGRKTVGAQSQIISRLQERIAAAERRLAGVAPPYAESDAAKGAPTSNGGDALKQAIRDRRAALPSAALPSVATPSPPAGRPAANSAGAVDSIADNPLIGQLLEYQARQRRLGRPRRVLLSLVLIALVAAALLGLGLLLSEMFGFELWRLGRTEAILDRAGPRVVGAPP